MSGRIRQRVDQVSTGDITEVVAGEALTGGGVTGSVSLAVALDDAGLLLAAQVFSG